VQEVVARIESNHVFDTLFTALGMHADSLEILVRSASEEPQIRIAKDGELLQRLFGVGFLVPKTLGPQVLIVSGQLGTILSPHHAEAIAPDQFRIGQVL